MAAHGHLSRQALIALLTRFLRTPYHSAKSNLEGRACYILQVREKNESDPRVFVQ